MLDSLKQGDMLRVFDVVACLFGEARNDGKLLEVEFLGKSHPLAPDQILLIDDNAAGIPKVRLIQAFTIAYKLFKTLALTGSPEPGRLDLEQIRRTSAVLLLTDPEHLTAANARKRAVLEELREGVDAGSCLGMEKYFVDSLLTSRLHRHTKSPVLWSHRRWLLEQFEKLGRPVDVASDFRRVVLVSGERHPKNYYAWSHARFLLETFRPGGDALRHIAADVEQWCLKHHDDISGWTMLHFLLSRKELSEGSECASVSRRVVRMAGSFRWRNESVRWFLHAMATTDLLGKADVGLLEVVGRMMSDAVGVDSEKARLAEKWLRDGFAQSGEGLA